MKFLGVQGVNEKQLPSLLSLKVDPPEQMMETPPTEVVLPQVLEEVLALKNQRARELEKEEEPDTSLVQQQPPAREALWEKDENIVRLFVFFARYNCFFLGGCCRK